MAHDYEPKHLKAIRLEREARRDDYFRTNGSEICDLSRTLIGGVAIGIPAQARQALAELAQHHTDLENHIEGNG